MDDTDQKILDYISREFPDPAHTPLPWWIDDDGFIAAGSGDDYQTVADPHCRPTVDCGDENGANAAFIISACNSHYELLAALKDCRAALHATKESLGLDHPAAIIAADNAIAKAERAS